MGLVNSGIPRDIVEQLAEISRAEVFVETGTFQGATTRWAANVFDEVHTIELAQQLYDQHHAELAAIQGVRPYLGDSATLLPQIVSELSTRPAVFWLDGHWSGGETAGEDNECPLLAELECIAGRRQDIVLIDDARLFLCAPPKPHRPEQWPTLAEILRIFERHRADAPRLVQIIDDVIYIVPDEPRLKQALVGYAQSRAGEASRKKPSMPAFRLFADKLLGV